MNIKTKLSLVILMCMVISACMSEPFNAPCNEYGTFCGTKTKINQW